MKTCPYSRTNEYGICMCELSAQYSKDGAEACQQIPYCICQQLLIKNARNVGTKETERIYTDTFELEGDK